MAKTVNRKALTEERRKNIQTEAKRLLLVIEEWKRKFAAKCAELKDTEQKLLLAETRCLALEDRLDAFRKPAEVPAEVATA